MKREETSLFFSGEWFGSLSSKETNNLNKKRRKGDSARSVLREGSAQGDQEAVKECYKEYIGMVKIYYEGAQRSKQGRPREDVVKNSSGTAWIKEPQAFAKMSVEIEDTLDGT
ncbi:hypothetical protein Tco_0297666, partial [Tanacetum coccineum]